MWAALSGRDLHLHRHAQFSPWETNTPSSQPLRTITQTFAEERHSWGETPHPTHCPTRETVKLQVNHTLAKRIIKEHPHTLIGLEDLTNIESAPDGESANAKRTAKGLSGSPQRHAKRIGCIRSGPLPNCMPLSATKRCSLVPWRSKSMQITPRSGVRCAGIPPRRTVQARGCCLSARTQRAAIPCMLIWLGHAI